MASISLSNLTKYVGKLAGFVRSPSMNFIKGRIEGKNE
jgi:hypothetical protein